MWETEKAWVKWFIRTYADSQKEEHRKMVIYVERMVQQHETDQGLPPLDLPEPHQGIVQPRCKGYPKAKAAPATASNMPADVMTVMSEDLNDPWDVMEPMTREFHQDPLPEEVQALQTRVLSIENALTEILSLESFQKIQQQRDDNLYQLALGLVLYRHQVSCGRHMHWEQPAKSIMLRIPLLREIIQGTIARVLTKVTCIKEVPMGVEFIAAASTKRSNGASMLPKPKRAKLRASELIDPRWVPKCDVRVRTYDSGSSGRSHQFRHDTLAKSSIRPSIRKSQ
ncbi:unnamed protein product [Cladocopium goreaui]|uniref:Copia protein n=1 Tax=Cladocopium goreaui TaxID=2562237 RepID=A0A9P1BUT8_9DINO|nr:unnamed protein product [Cladocopium goreaui]